MASISPSELRTNTELVMGGKAGFRQERGQFSAHWHLEEASSDGWQLLKILPRCWHEDLPGLCRSHLMLGGCGVIVKAVSTVLMAPDLFSVYKSGRSKPIYTVLSWWELLLLNLKGMKCVLLACTLSPRRWGMIILFCRVSAYGCVSACLCLGPPVPHQEEQAKLDSVLLPISISHPLMLPRQYVFNPVFLGLNSSSRSSYWSSLCSVPQRCGLLPPAQPHPAVSSPTPRPGNVDDDHARVQVTI